MPDHRGPDETRAALIQAAMELFAERGYAGTAVPDVAARAKVAAGTLYRHFEGKQALLNASFRRAKRLCSSITTQGFIAWLDGKRDVADKEPDAFDFIERHRHTYLDDESRALNDEVWRAAAKLIEEAQARDEMCELSPVLLAALVDGAFVGLRNAQREGRIPDDDRSFSEARERIWRLVAKD